MRHLKTALILSVTLLASACGTLIEGATQKVTLQTPGATEAECTFDNGVRYIISTGETIEIMRTKHDIVVDCYAVGNRHKQIVVPNGYNEWSTANIANGVAPGMAYDYLSGGLFDYPPVITVDFGTVQGNGFELPEYHNKDAPNPYAQSIEDYGPTTPRIENDSAYMKRGVNKRGASNSNPFSTFGGESAEPQGMTPLPQGTAPLASPSAKNPAPVLKGGSADELTRSMNPSVFGNQ